MSERRGLDARFLQELKEKNNLVEVVASYTSLEKKGNSHWACCPFHHEKTPSFAVNESEQFYHCFGCGESGDVIKFVREMESTDFMGAIRILADRAKMQVPENNLDSDKIREEAARRKRMVAIMLDAAKFYRANLYGGKADAHLEYISRRQISPSIVKQFGLGASLDFFSLADYLLSKGYKKEDLLGSGVLAESKNGKLIDAQAGRFIFPIINASDEVVAFGGRSLEKTDFAKYKNTKETLLFNKSKTLYNVNLLKKFKRENPISEVIIVEGYMDTISLYQAGFKNVVASMGTSLTKDQARLVKRYSENVLISYDGDFAGQKADLRGLEILKDEHLRVKVVPMPEGLDPDDVAKQGREAYQVCLDKAMPLIDYKIHALRRKFDLQTTEGKRGYIAEAVKVIETAESASEREDLLKRLSKQTGITYGSLERDLHNLPKTGSAQAPVAPQDVVAGTDKYKKAARFVLATKLFQIEYAKETPIEKFEFDEETHKIIAEYIRSCQEKGEGVHPSYLFEILDENTVEFNEILDLNYEDKLSGEIGKKFFFDSVRVLQQQQIERNIKRYKDLAEEETDMQKRKEYTKMILQYTQKAKDLAKEKRQK